MIKLRVVVVVLISLLLVVLSNQEAFAVGNK